MINQRHLEKGCVLLFVVALLYTTASAKPPSEEDISIYARACSIGAANTYSDETEFRVALGVLKRKALGEGEVLSKSSIEDLKQEFPGLKGEKSRLQALTLYQDCLFRYIEKFHSGTDTEPTATFSPEIPDERRRELLFLVDRLDEWKQTMKLAVSILPKKYYDKKSGTSINLRADRRVAEIDTYQPYEMFREASGEFDFSNLTNNDLAILCQIWQREITNYYKFHQQYKTKFPTLPDYWWWPYLEEEKRICNSATAAR